MIHHTILFVRCRFISIAFLLLGIILIHEVSSSASASASRTNSSTLITVQIVSRHGTRAPNPVVSQICPSDIPNLSRYNDLRLTLAGLTGTGQRELYALGVYTRQTYIERTYPHFVSQYFNDEEVYFRAVGEDRTIQSAVCMGQGMYPAGTAAIGYYTDLPSPVPIYTLPDEMDSLLEVRKHDCAKRLKEDGAKWDATEGIKLYQSHTDLIERMMEICNITDLNDVIVGSGDNYGDAIKDITDAMTFDMIEGFPVEPGLNYSSLLEFRTLAVKQLLGRIIGTEEQITYMNGQLPERLASNFINGVATQGPKPASTHGLKMYAYHGHREMMYALGAFLGIEFDIDFPGLPKGAIPPATTLFFELHYVGELDSNGRPPNPWTANNLTNPYDHRMVEPDQMPPPKRQWGEPFENEVNAQSQQQSTKLDTTTLTPPTERRQDRPASATPSSVSTNKNTGANKGNGLDGSTGVVRLDSTPPSREEAEAQQEALAHPVQSSYPDAPAEHNVVSTGNSNGTSNADTNEQRRVALRRLLQTTTPNRTGENELNGHRPHRKPEDILPHQTHATGGSSGLVRIPDSRMPEPPLKDYVVKAFLWRPCTDTDVQSKKDKNIKSPKESKDSSKKSADCPSVPVKMTAICDSYECTLDDFRTKMEARVQRTGTWDKLCDVKHEVSIITADVSAARSVDEEAFTNLVDVDSNQQQSHQPPKSRFHFMRWLVIIMLGALIYFGIKKYRAMYSSSPRYRDEEDYISFTSSSHSEERAPLNRVF